MTDFTDPRLIERQAQAARAVKESCLAVEGENLADDLHLDMVEGETSLFEVFDTILMRMVEDKVLIAGIEAVEKDLADRKRRLEKRQEDCRTLIEQGLMIAELPGAVERPLATLTLTKRPPKVEVSEESEVPARFWKASDPKLDKAALSAALKAGEAIPGACLSNAAPTLTARFK